MLLIHLEVAAESSSGLGGKKETDGQAAVEANTIVSEARLAELVETIEPLDDALWRCRTCDWLNAFDFSVCDMCAAPAKDDAAPAPAPALPRALPPVESHSSLFVPVGQENHALFMEPASSNVGAAKHKEEEDKPSELQAILQREIEERESALTAAGNAQRRMMEGVDQV